MPDQVTSSEKKELADYLLDCMKAKGFQNDSGSVDDAQADTGGENVGVETTSQYLEHWRLDLDGSSLLTCSDKDEIMKDAMERYNKQALDQNENQQSATGVSSRSSATAKSFSLFDTLGASSQLLSRRIMWEDIEACDTLDSKLEMLRKVDHIDDILSDWDNGVNPLLREGLLVHKNKACHTELLDLHQTWFYQTTDGGVRSDLALNLLQTLFSADDGGKRALDWNDDSIVFDVVQVWHAMWMTLILQEQDRKKPEDDTLRLLFEMVADHDKETRPILLYLALVDPKATWFRHLVIQMPPKKLAELLRSTNENNQRFSSKLLSQLQSVVVCKTTPSSPTERVVYCHAVYMLGALVLQLRVGLMMELLGVDDTTWLLSTFCTAARHGVDRDLYEPVIQALIWGCDSSEKIKTIVEHVAQQEPPIHVRLHDREHNVLFGAI